ncbi:hypothetical protein HPP92_004141 [Vanilla planifolia]|uniref:Formin-like protein n=1 Tax=Vanilla planifolia TaxID=51239 RepID=A0A835VJM1_VANPL|nr:hypothetical protein HPP92_004141 [Vanilla planifolia]
MASHVPSASPSPPQLPPSENVPEPPNVGPPALKPGPPPPKGGPIPPKLPRQAQIGSNSSSIPYPPPTRSSDASGGISAKTKLKPFFWDKVAANPDQSMVWHQIKSGSFQFNEEMIETLFGYNAADKHRNDAMKDFANDLSSRRIQILDSKKSQNLAISIKAQNVKVEEVCDALMEGNELPVELLQVLLRMAPTADEELKLRLFNDQTAMLGTAEQFLKSLLNIPFAFKRMEALLFMTTLREESTFVKESLTILEATCKELRNSRLFLKLLEAVLKTGNRMNDGTYRGGAQAFKLDTLLKLSDVKGADGKTTLLHFVVQEIIRSEGRRAVHVAVENRSNPNVSIPSLSSQRFAEGVTKESEDQYCTIGLRVVSGLSSELENVKRAAGLDADALASYLSSLHQRLEKSRGFLNTDMRNLEEESNFHDSLKAFVVHADADIAFLLMEEKRIKLLVKNTTDYFHGSAGRDEGLRLFVIVRDFLGMLQKACKDVREAPMQVIKTPRNKGNTTRQMLFPSIRDRRVNDSSSDEERS